MKRVILTADDFGLSIGVNEAVERAHRAGILTAASLMVAGPAAADAVRRARALPGLRVGLHLVVIDGPAMLPPSAIPDLVDARGWFGAEQVRRGFAYFFRPRVRRQLAAEIAAQFAAFAETGLPLDHADAHRHMHAHPLIGRLLIDIGRAHGLRALRVPAEPASVVRACGERVGVGARALHAWTRLLRAQARRAGLVTNDHAFGIAWSGRVTAARLRRLAAHLPDGLSEIYLHPATRRDALLERRMPGYQHEAEFAALVDPGVAEALRAAGATLTTYAAGASG
ncbi:MAG: hopanoid biosynthesis-associated protein HpnK [Acidisphaera sp.]|nr:hopanoid biosynthesis-associated protein HpnK [Acidisphaera sp.]